MPLLDVATDVFFDADFVDTTPTYTRNLQVADQNGRVSNQQTIKPFTAIITSQDGSLLNRGDAASHITDTILVHTMTVLIDGEAGYDADVVTWNNATWTVKNVNDYSSYGPGFVCAVCELVQLAGGAQ